MSQKIQLPLETKCYLCDSYYANLHQVFFVYKCFICMNLTPYCLPCELKLQKLFGKGYFFKCLHCDKLTNALDKIEVEPPNNNININITDNSFFKTPSKPFMENNTPISSIRHNNSNFFIKINQNEEETKGNNNTNRIMLSNFLNDFNKININLLNKKTNNDRMNSPFTHNSNNQNNKNQNYLNNTIIANDNNRNINIPDFSKEASRTLTNSSSFNNIKKINDFSLLTSRNRLNKRNCLNESLLSRKRDDSFNEPKISRLNRSRGKFKNLISMKMSKVYSNGNKNNANENTIDDYRKKNYETKAELSSRNNFCGINNNNDNLAFNLLTERNKKNNNNTSVNPFLNNQRGINFNFLDGKSTPHRLSNNSFEYF